MGTGRTEPQQHVTLGLEYGERASGGAAAGVVAVGRKFSVGPQDKLTKDNAHVTFPFLPHCPPDPSPFCRTFSPGGSSDASMGGQSIEPPTTPNQAKISSGGRSPLPTKGGDRSVNDRTAKAAELVSGPGRPSKARFIDAMGVLVGQSSGIIHPKSLNSVVGEWPPKLGTAKDRVSGSDDGP